MFLSHKLQSEIEINKFDKFNNPIDSQILTGYPFGKDFISITVRNNDGSIAMTHKMPMQSFNRNFLGAFTYGFGGNTEAWTTSGSKSGTNQISCNAGVNGGYGIKLGTGNNPVNATDLVLQSPIAHGTGPGQISHAPTVVTNIIDDPIGWKYSISRVFNNLSGGDIVVQEVGIYGQPYSTYMFARDVVDYNGIPINITVADTQSVEVIYTFYIDVAEGFLKNTAVYIKRLCEENYSSPAYKSITNTNVGSTNLYFNQTPYDEMGIVVGTSDAPVTIDDYGIEGSRILNGTAEGQLVYSQMVLPSSISVVNNVSEYMISRSFSNQSSGNVTIKELALYGVGGGSTTRICIFRKLTGNLLLEPGQSVTLNVKFKAAA